MTAKRIIIKAFSVENEKRDFKKKFYTELNLKIKMELQKILSKMEAEGWQIDDDFKTAHGFFLQYFLETVEEFRQPDVVGRNEQMVETSEKMNEFLNKVDALCFEYGYEIHPTIHGWTGEKDTNGKYKTIAIIGENEICEVLFIDGDGLGDSNR